MSRVTADDWADIGRNARGYCRKVDATRSRKRANGSATIVKNGHAPYGTDDASDDVCQDAVLIFARRLRDVMKSCPVVAQWIDSREPAMWEYTRRDGQTSYLTRSTLHRWAVHDAAARNGYKIDVPADEIDATPGDQLMRGVPHAENVTSLAVTTGVSRHSEEIFARAYGDGSEFPTLSRAMFIAGMADDLGRAGILATVAQAEHGGAYGSRRNVIRTRDAGTREWEDLSERIDDARNDLVYRSISSDARADSPD